MTQTPREIVPSGCAHCGLDHRTHYRRWTASAGWHGYTPPSQDQIKARMLARRTR